MRDIACANRTMPEWDSYQRGLETLASALGSVNGTGESSKKSLTVSDLLVKVSHSISATHQKYPRVCAYVRSSLFKESASILCYLRNS